MTKIKICGVTRVVDAAHAAAAGADFIGINFWSRSKRYVETAAAPPIAAAARAAGAQVVGVFVDATADEIAAVVARVGLDIVQLHGAESPADVVAIARESGRVAWKAIAVATAADLDDLDAWSVDALLLDTPTPGRGGSGTTFDWSLAAAAIARHPARRIVLAGGVTPANVARAVAEVAPFGVDVASGVEASPGIKDPAKVTEFIAAVRAQSR